MTGSSIFSNVFLGLATLAYLLLIKDIFLKPMPGGDYGVGYALAAMYLSFAYLICLALAALGIWVNGGFHWMEAGGAPRIGLIALALLTIAIATFMGVMMKQEGYAIFGYLARVMAMFSPVLVLASGMVLANEGLRNRIAPPLVKWALAAVFCLSLAVIATYVLGLAYKRLEITMARLTADPTALNDFEQGMLKRVDTIDVQKEMVMLLSYTAANKKPQIRDRAIARVKSRPDWQEELVRRLDSGWASEVFTFLADNEVDNKALFPEAIRLGILKQAEDIRSGIGDRRDFYADFYGWETERTLRAVDKFKGMGVDFRPAISDFKRAFGNDPDRKYKAAKFIQKWLDKNN